MTKAARKIKKGDKVVVLAGKDRGVKGEVLKVLTEENRVVVQGVNMVTRHRKPSQISGAALKKRIVHSRIQRGAA